MAENLSEASIAEIMKDLLIASGNIRDAETEHRGETHENRL
jgi:hypothetical protein